MEALPGAIALAEPLDALACSVAPFLGISVMHADRVKWWLRRTTTWWPRKAKGVVTGVINVFVSDSSSPNFSFRSSPTAAFSFSASWRALSS